MDIKIGSYRLTNDSMNFIVSEVFISDGDKHKGQEYQSNHSYHTSIEQALNNVLKRRLLKSDSTTLRELQKDLYGMRGELRELFAETI